MSCIMTGCDREIEAAPGLCRRHYHQKYIGGLSQEQLEALWDPQCAMPGCEGPGEQLDHDPSCCPGGLGRKRRCGNCNRGFLCARCNRETGMVERNTSLHTVRIPPDRLSAIYAYLKPAR